MNNNFSNIDKNTLDAAKRGDVDAVLKNVSAEDKKKIEQTLADKDKLKQLLNSDAARALIKILGGDKKNG